MASNELFQYSVVSALMDGVASTGISIPDLLSHGSHGLGTFKHMVGEMIVLDGEIYQMKSDGSVSAIESTAGDIVAPFAMVTAFEPTITRKVAFDTKEKLSGILSRLLPGTKNHFVAFRVDGRFKALTMRTVGGQTVPHESLTALGKHQTSHSFTAISGTVIGFRSPLFMQGISVAGDHLHFIADDRTHGGHLLTCESEGEVDISAAPIARVHLELPSHDEEYNQAKLEADGEGIAAVEG